MLRHADVVAAAALSEGQVRILRQWQARHFRKVKLSFRGRRIAAAWPGAGLLASESMVVAALSQAQVELAEGEPDQ